MQTTWSKSHNHLSQSTTWTALPWLYWWTFRTRVRSSSQKAMFKFSCLHRQSCKWPPWERLAASFSCDNSIQQTAWASGALQVRYNLSFTTKKQLRLYFHSLRTYYGNTWEEVDSWHFFKFGRTKYVRTCLLGWDFIISDTHACKELHKRSHKFALQNFQEVMSTEEFLLLPFQEVSSNNPFYTLTAFFPIAYILRFPSLMTYAQHGTYLY